MKTVTVAALVFLLSTQVAAAPPPKLAKPRVRVGRAFGTPALLNTKNVTPIRLAPKPLAGSDGDAMAPAEGDPDRERIQRLQEALDNIVHGPVLGRLRVGVRVMELATGRVLFGRHGSSLMDPASNQKVLATATALLRLGSDWQFRTELAGPAPDADGVIAGDVVLRGTGDPSLRGAHREERAGALPARGVTRVRGGVLADPGRIGSGEPGDTRPPLRVSRSAIEVRVRPADRDGAP